MSEKHAKLPAAGALLGDKYRVERVLGAGGMGAVLGVRHTRLDEPRALKLMLPEAPLTASSRERFFREARSAARLRSQHATRVHDVGELPDGSPYIEMELLEGEDLAALLERSGPLPIERVISWMLEACEALAEAHAAGIVHRDIKPANLFLARGVGDRSLIKVLDFGIAKLLNAGSGALTATNAAVGSPLYMAPEQLRSAALADPRSDVWALGVTMFELLTGRPPFVADSITALTLVIASDQPPRPASLRPTLPRALEHVILRCLEKDPAARFASIDALAAALRAARDARAAGHELAADLAATAVPSPACDEAALTERAPASSSAVAAPGAGPGTGSDAARAGFDATEVGPRLATGDPVARTLPDARGPVPAPLPSPTPTPPSADGPGRRPWGPLAAVAATGVGLLAAGITRRRERRRPRALVAAVLVSLVAAGTIAMRHRPPPAAPEASAATPAPAVGLSAIETLRSPRGADGALVSSEPYWQAARSDFALAAARPGAPPRWAAAERLASGFAALARSDYPAADAALRAAAQQDPAWALPPFGLSLARSRQGDTAGAIDAAQQAERLDPAWHGGAWAAARALAHAGRGDDAIQEYRRAISKAPGNALLLGELALVYHAASLDSEAERHGRLALELDPDLAAVRVMLAERALERGDGKTALDEASRAAAISPGSAPARLAEAEALQLLGRDGDARHAFEKAVSLWHRESPGDTSERFASVERALADGHLPRSPGAGSPGPSASAPPRPPARRVRTGCPPGDPLCGL
jgi:eukaryotic-like serine/threonine-protein kinase